MDDPSDPTAPSLVGVEPPLVQPAATTSAPPDTGEAWQEELALLEVLEGDLAAVEAAIESLDRIAADGPGGERAAQEIDAAVSAERFGTGASPVPSPTGTD